ncbi:hypothetical protein ACSBR2_025176 [Camellia fascicularis]
MSMGTPLFTSLLLVLSTNSLLGKPAQVLGTFLIEESCMLGNWLKKLDCFLFLAPISESVNMFGVMHYPPKFPFFCWLAWKNRIKSSEFLHRIGILDSSVSTLCPFCCSESESAVHVLLHFPFFLVDWVLIKEELEAAGATLDNEFLANEKKERTEFKKSIPTDVRKARDTHLIVATLIATVTFAAGFTMTGGYNSNDDPNQGMAILTREAAFKAFVVTDSMAMILSTCAVLIYFASADYGDQTKLLYRYSLAAGLLMIATGAMVLAFITGIYAVLPHSSNLAIPICIIVVLDCIFEFEETAVSINSEGNQAYTSLCFHCFVSL